MTLSNIQRHNICDASISLYIIRKATLLMVASDLQLAVLEHQYEEWSPGIVPAFVAVENVYYSRANHSRVSSIVLVSNGNQMYGSASHHISRQSFRGQSHASRDVSRGSESTSSRATVPDNLHSAMSTKSMPPEISVICFTSLIPVCDHTTK